MTTPPDTPKPSEFPPREIWVWIDGEGCYEVRDEQPNKVAERYILAPSPQESHKLAEELERLIDDGASCSADKLHEAIYRIGMWTIDKANEIRDALRSSPSEQDARDAARYRYIERNLMSFGHGKDSEFVGVEMSDHCNRFNLGARIDFAIAASGGAKE